MNNLFDAAYRCITADEPTKKIQLTQTTAQAWQTGKLNLNPDQPIKVIVTPGQPSTLRLVPPKALPRRNLTTLTGQVAFLHALIHIEFNAINLAWDAVYRFRDLPNAFYDDWVKVAGEEAYHFGLLHEQLQQLGYRYGDLNAHNGLWEMAIKTAHDVLARMALVPRVLEARGLDIMPTLITKVQSQGLSDWVTILQIILHDEIGHVAIGSRWFSYCCQERNLNPQTTFQSLIIQHFNGRVKTPFNVEARLAAGFTQQDLTILAELANSN